MTFSSRKILAGVVCGALFSGCGGGAGDANPGAADPVTPAMGNISFSITDGPRADTRAMVLHITGMELGHSNGDVITLDMPNGAVSADMMQLQNGVHVSLVTGVDIPMGQYDWVRLHVDLSQSYVELSGTGGQHGMHMGSDATNGIEVHEPFELLDSINHEFMLEFDLQRGVQHHDMGMMGVEYELHSAMRLVDMEHAGGLSGMIDASMIDINHPDCDQEPGGNWAYLFPGDATVPDDVAASDTDGIPGPITTDRVEMDPATGDHNYHFGYLPEGSYRIAFTCSGEWDEFGDDDYPADPDGRFDFQMFSNPMDVVAGHMGSHHKMP
jgi:hypothetical protein